MVGELRHSLRLLFKSPGFTLVTVLTLALGIGSTTAIFSVVDSIILKPLPYPEPDRLMRLYEVPREGGEGDRFSTTVPNFMAWQQRSQSFELLGAVFDDFSFQLTGAREPDRIEGALVSPGLFELLGKKPRTGRSLQESDGAPGAEPVIIASYRLWRRLGGDPDLVGKTLTLNGRTFTVVGIMPDGFEFPDRKAEAWAPLAMDATRSNPFARILQAYGRLKPGASLTKARQEMLVIATDLEQERPAANSGMTVLVEPLKKTIVGDTDRPLLLLLGAVVFVLLIACVNVVNLFLLRTLGRQREIAVCTAFGASRLRVFRRFVIDGLLLAFLGGGLGVLLAFWAVRLFVAISPPEIPRLSEVAVDGRALALALVLSLLTGIVLALAPGISIYGPRLEETLRLGNRGADEVQRKRLRRLLVVSEVALAVVLLIGAGLMVESYRRLYRVDPGFRPQNVLTAEVTLPYLSYARDDQRSAFFDQSLQRIRDINGVESAGAASYIPLAGSDLQWSFVPEGQAVEEGKEPAASYRVVDGDYFRAMGFKLVSGRLFETRDHQLAPPSVIVNETMARQVWPGQQALGKRIRIGSIGSTQPWATVIGVVGDVHHSGLDVPAPAEMYLPYSPLWWEPTMTLVVRTKVDPVRLVDAVRSSVWAVDKDLPLYNVRTMTQVVDESLARQRLNLMLISLFASVALVLAMVGIYGIMAQSVVQETQKIAVRMALGALRRDILTQVLQQGLVLVAGGVILGVLVAIGVTRLMASLLFGVTATDPATFFAVAFTFVLVALIALSIPALRATRVDPLVCLKD
jgi:putative ABC transport system permease protein